MTGPDPKSGKRSVDPKVVRSTLLRFNWCAACGGCASNAHHVIQKGSPHFGDDEPGNIVGLCGTGTMRCHGAIHGSPYVAELSHHGHTERRDQEWVARRIGEEILKRRPDVIAYVIRKLSETAGWDYLERTYYVVRPASESPRL